jgi:zinc finger protein
MYKSESTEVSIPEIGIELSAGTQGSIFTVVEGMLSQIRDNLRKTTFLSGDSSVPEE